jgi:hypothetical protein
VAQRSCGHDVCGVAVHGFPRAVGSLQYVQSHRPAAGTKVPNWPAPTTDRIPRRRIA